MTQTSQVVGTDGATVPATVYEYYDDKVEVDYGDLDALYYQYYQQPETTAVASTATSSAASSESTSSTTTAAVV